MVKFLFQVLILQILFTSYIAAQELNLVALLPGAIHESSGLIDLDGRLITHVDSDGANALFEIDTTDGSILRTIYVENASNSDWEDITRDDDYIYIGDFGNNSGSRTNLKVYRVSINNFLNTLNDTINADTIAFSYANQVDFTSGSNNTDFDAEALIACGDSLYIFSKNWLTNTCDIYALSKLPGSYSISKIDSFNSEGLITGATYEESTNELYLCGYGPPIPFIILVSNFNGFPIFTGSINKTTLQVPTGSSVQIEAITSRDAGSLYISSEVSVLGEASLMTLSKSGLVGIRSLAKNALPLYPNPSRSYITVAKDFNDFIELYNLQGECLKVNQSNQIKTSHLASGMYIILVRDEYGAIRSRNSFIVKD